MNDFHDIVDTDGLDPDEEARLRRVHELLVQAGPPPDLPPALERPPTAPAEGELVQFPMLPRRRWALAAVAAAALALLAFGGGYLVGHAKTKPTTFATKRVVPMHGQRTLAVLRIGRQDKAGNWPMELEVTGLPTQKDRRRLLRAVADEEREADRAVRLVPRQRAHDDASAVGAVRLQALRRLGRDRAAGERPGPAPSSSRRKRDPDTLRLG